MKMKYTNFLIASGIITCLVFFVLSVSSDEFKAPVSEHKLTISPDQARIISGENVVINVEIKNTDDDKIFIKLGAKDVPESWITYEKQLFNLEAGESGNTKMNIHIPEGRIGDYSVSVIAKNPETNVEVAKTLKIEALPPKDKGMSGIPIFPPAEQPILLLIDALYLLINGIASLLF
jgi:uncharacterized membrane protein